MSRLKILALWCLLCLIICACSADKERAYAALTETNAQLQLKVDSLSALLDSVTSKADSKPDNFSLLQEEDIAYLQQQGLANPVEAIKNDLAKNNKLIPVKGILGGTMQFYKERIQILNRRWVLAYFEDGHNAGEMLLEYTVTDNGSITWKVLTTSEL